MNTTIRDLSDAELSQVSGGQCTCGDGANCVGAAITTTPGGDQFVRFYNCSGVLVAAIVM